MIFPKSLGNTFLWMKFYVGITDRDWFEHLKALGPDEVNFWKPGGSANFRALQPGEPFLFKLHAPHNYIVGGGFFVRFSILPNLLAWDTFGELNGALGETFWKWRIGLPSNQRPTMMGDAVRTAWLLKH